MWGNHEDWMWDMGGLHMGLGWILILVVVAVVVWLLVRGPLSVSGSGAERPRALDILKERYARGEIDREEFEQKKRDLEA
jgi:putative membrane protein